MLHLDLAHRTYDASACLTAPVIGVIGKHTVHMVNEQRLKQAKISTSSNRQLFQVNIKDLTIFR